MNSTLLTEKVTPADLSFSTLTARLGNDSHSLLFPGAPD